MARWITRKVDLLGRVVIPAEHRKALGLETDTPLEITRVGQELRMRRADSTCGGCDRKRVELVDGPAGRLCRRCISAYE